MQRTSVFLQTLHETAIPRTSLGRAEHFAQRRNGEGIIQLDILEQHTQLLLQKGTVRLDHRALGARRAFDVNSEMVPATHVDLTSHQGEPGSISDRPTLGFSQVGITPDDSAGQRLSSGISHLPLPFIPVLLHSHLISPSSALNTPLLRAAQISRSHCNITLSYGTTPTLADGDFSSSLGCVSTTELSPFADPRALIYHLTKSFAHAVKKIRSSPLAVAMIQRSTDCRIQPGGGTIQIASRRQSVPLSISSSALALVSKTPVDARTISKYSAFLSDAPLQLAAPRARVLHSAANARHCRCSEVVRDGASCTGKRERGKESAMAFVRRRSQHSSEVISENHHGKQKSGWPVREPNSRPPECESSELPLHHLARSEGEYHGLERPGNIQILATEELFGQEHSKTLTDFELLQGILLLAQNCTQCTHAAGSNNQRIDIIPLLVAARPKSRSEGAIRATVTRTPSASSLLRARGALGSPLVDNRSIMNAAKYRAVFGVVWTNRTMVSSNTDTNRTGVLAVDKISVKHVHAEVDFAIGSQFSRHDLDDSDPIADLQGNNRVGAVYVLVTAPRLLKAVHDKDKIDVKHVYTEVDFAIGSQFSRHDLDDSDPIADLQGNK
ncbi:hypothetical protein PR048_025815 [Dryococelus australis]|uniref:Uncharacterized protein n=1 Tax=Dryococelus australis TaxID=614101 RepID=A0ABQ9GJM9_9NEOP|nr:hypothetical protein PR048_025815 [Dryococelus australis]